MKNILITLIIVLLSYSCSTNETNRIETNTKIDTLTIESNYETDTFRSRIYNTRINDTFFIQRITANGLYDVIYIDTNRTNQFYLDIQKKDEIDISGIYEFFKTPLKTINTSNFADKWIELIMYKGELYVEKPSDWYLLNRFIINDSLYITGFSEPNISLMKSIKKLNKNKYQLIYETWKNTKDTTNVYLIEPKRKVYLFENFSQSGKSYFFATPITNVFSFDLLNTDCNQYKTFGPTGDKVDYKKFINCN